MATTSVKVTIQRAKLITVVGPMADRAAYRAAQKTRGYVISEIRAAGRVKTGRMIQLTQARKSRSGSPLVKSYEVSSTAPYTGFQNDGTRAHGPRTARMLAFVPKGGSKVVFARWVRGVQGAHFMERAVARVRVADFLG